MMQGNRCTWPGEDEDWDLPASERHRLNNLLREYEDVFQPGGPYAALAEHLIDTWNSSPVSTPSYRLLQAKRNIVQRKIGEILENGIIEECNSL